MKGSIAEAKFVAMATEKGFIISWPLQPAIYDVLLDNGNKIFKVQVKSMSFLRNYKGRKFYRLSLIDKKSKKIKYNSSNVDTIVCLVNNEHWYVVPIDEIIGKRELKFRPDSIAMKTSVFLENWQFFA